MRKCGNCYHFWVKPDEIALAQHAPHISECQPGKPHCLGGQVRGACDVWQERKAKGMPMPWSDGPMVESTFFCRLWQRGGPRSKAVGSYNEMRPSTKKLLTKASIIGIVSAAVPFVASMSRFGGASIRRNPFFSKDRAMQIDMWYNEKPVLGPLYVQGYTALAGLVDKVIREEPIHNAPSHHSFTMKLQALWRQAFANGRTTEEIIPGLYVRLEPTSYISIHELGMDGRTKVKMIDLRVNPKSLLPDLYWDPTEGEIKNAYESHPKYPFLGR
jgi:hypothetical protein